MRFRLHVARFILITLALCVDPSPTAPAPTSPKPAPKNPPPVTKAKAPPKPGAAAPKPDTVKPKAPPAPGATAVSLPGITPSTLGAVLKGLGYLPKPQGGYQRLEVKEEKYGYLIDLSLSRSGEWLVAMAHLAPVPDLTKVPAAPLLGLLSRNDLLLGMYFSYNREESQLMLNATRPTKGLTPDDLRAMLDGMRTTIRQTDGLWDPTKW